MIAVEGYVAVLEGAREEIPQKMGIFIAVL